MRTVFEVPGAESVFVLAVSLLRERLNEKGFKLPESYDEAFAAAKEVAP